MRAATARGSDKDAAAKSATGLTYRATWCRAIRARPVPNSNTRRIRLGGVRKNRPGPMQYGGGPLGHARGSPSQFDSVDEELLAALNSHAASLVEDLDSADNKPDCCDAHAMPSPMPCAMPCTTPLFGERILA